MVFQSACSFFSSEADGVPVRRFGQLFRAFAERFLPREVVVPFLLLGRQIVAATREEGVARGAEALRQIARSVARHRPGVLPGLLQLLESRGGLGPVGRVGQRFGLLDERGLGGEVRASLLAQLREIDLAAAADEVRGGLEAIPQPLRRMPRRVRHFLPSQVEFTEGLGRGRQFGFLARLFFGLQRRDNGFRHRDELFLLLGVGKPAPLVHVAQFLHARRDVLLQLAQDADGLADLLRASRPRRPWPRSAVVMSRSSRSPSRKVMDSESAVRLARSASRVSLVA